LELSTRIIGYAACNKWGFMQPQSRFAKSSDVHIAHRPVGKTACSRCGRRIAA
jgi:hypothetical protein